MLQMFPDQKQRMWKLFGGGGGGGGGGRGGGGDISSFSPSSSLQPQQLLLPLTEHFTISQLQNPRIDEMCVVQNSRSPDFAALKLKKVWSGWSGASH